MEKVVKLDVVDGVARILLDTPKNAIGPAFMVDFAEVVAQVAGIEGLRVVLLANTGDTFCVGGDIKDFKSDMDAFADKVGSSLGLLNTTIQQLASLPVPLVCAVNGPFGGGGIALALCGDLVFATDSTKLRGGYTAIGLTPDVGASLFLVRRAGLARAKRIMFLNEEISAAKCLDWGIFDEVLPAEQFHERVESVLLDLKVSATTAIGRTKKLLEDALITPLEEQLVAEHSAMIASAQGSEAREGITAFMQKRRPKF